MINSGLDVARLNFSHGSAEEHRERARRLAMDDFSLESSGRQPRPLTADDVIALSQAQAPKDVIQALLDMSARSAPPPGFLSKRSG